MDIKEKFTKHALDYVDQLKDKENISNEEADASIKVLLFFVDYVLSKKGKIKIKELTIEFVDYIIEEGKKIESEIIKDEDRSHVVYFLQGFVKYLKEKEND